MKINFKKITGLLLMTLIIATANAKVIEIKVLSTDTVVFNAMSRDTALYKSGDTIMLDAGTYIEPRSLDVWKNVTLMAKPGLAAKPKIVLQSGGIRWKAQKMNLTVKDIIFEGKKADGTVLNSDFISINQTVNANNIDTVGNIKMYNCEFYNNMKGFRLGNWAYVSIDTFIMDNIVWHHKDSTQSTIVFNFADAGVIHYLSVTNSTFYNVGGGFIDNPLNSTKSGFDGRKVNKKVVIDHNTFYKFLSKGKSLIETYKLADSTFDITITNNVFHTMWDTASVKTFWISKSSGPVTIANNCFYKFKSKYYNFDTLATLSNVSFVNNRFSNPGFKDTLHFNIADTSALLTAGKNGEALGDPDWVPVIGVVITPLTQRIYPGLKVPMAVSVSLGEGADKTVTWKCINSYDGGSGAATIDNAGQLSATSVGKIAVVAVSNFNNAITDTLVIDVVEQIWVNSITLAGTDAEGNAKSSITNKGGYIKYRATILPGNADNPAFTWSVINGIDSKGKGKATIDENGNLVAAASGTVKVKATAKDGSGVFGEVTVPISGQVPVTKVEITAENNATSITTDKGTLKLTAVVTPDTADNPQVTWSLSDSSKAVITDGSLKALNNGVITVTATSKENRFVKGTIQITLSNQTPVALESKELVSIQITPNPAYNEIKVIALQSTEVSIYNIAGQLEIYSTVEANGTLNIQNLKPGLYIVKVKSGDQVKSLRMLKK